jgi:K+ potassium transporter
MPFWCWPSKTTAKAACSRSTACCTDTRIRAPRAGFREAILILSVLILVVTGGEAMYADLGHFGARPIRIGWFTVVFPALLLNYLGQGAYLLGGAEIAGGVHNTPAPNSRAGTKLRSRRQA